MDGSLGMRTVWTKGVLRMHQDGGFFAFLDTYPRTLNFLAFLGDYRYNKLQKNCNYQNSFSVRAPRDREM